MSGPTRMLAALLTPTAAVGATSGHGTEVCFNIEFFFLYFYFHCIVCIYINISIVFYIYHVSVPTRMLAALLTPTEATEATTEHGTEVCINAYVFCYTATYII